MKKAILLLAATLPMALFSCSTAKPVVDNSLVLKEHQAPYKVFGVGYWRPGYAILTLTDAGNKYFVIKTNNTDEVKVGSEYKP